MEKFQDIKDKISVFLINQEKNAEWLRNVLYVPMNDMAKVFYIKGTKQKEGPFYIEPSIYRKWEISIEELTELAINNTQKFQPAKIETALEAHLHIYEKYFDFPIPESIKSSNRLEETGYVLSNESSILGAVCILYKDTLKNFVNGKDHDLIIVSVNVDNVYLFLDDGKKSDKFYSSMLKEYNDYDEPEKILSRNVFRYNRKKNMLKSCLECTRNGILG